MAELIMKAHQAMSFSNRETRDQFVRFIADVLAAGRGEFEPHQLNAASTDLEWGVDAGNDWWVFFDREDWSRVRIKQRYDVAPALVGIAGLIAYRWRMAVLTPQYAPRAIHRAEG